MAKAYYSTVFNKSVDEVWAIIKDFNDDRWSGEVTESASENGKSGSTVGTIRNHKFRDTSARSDLRAYSEVDHSFTYGFVGTPPLPIQNYQATLRVTPVTDNNHAFIEWLATFDAEDSDRWATNLNESFATWLSSLRKMLD